MDAVDSLIIQTQPGYNLDISADSQIWMSVLFMLTCIGAITSIIVIISSLRQQINASTVLLLSLSVADFLYTLQTLIFTTINLSVGKWVVGRTGGEINYTVTMICVLSSGMGLALITIERYIAIFYQTSLTKPRAILWIAMAWAISIITTFLPIFAGSLDKALTISPSLMYCSFDWTNHEPVVLGSVITVLFIFIVNLSIILFGYYRIVTFYIRQKSQTRKKKWLNERERLLIKKALIICIVFIICWIPIASTIVYQEFTQNTISINLDAFTIFLTSINSIINPFLLISLDGRIKQNVYMYLNIPLKGSHIQMDSNIKTGAASVDELGQSEAGKTLHQ
ncbi:hypothetical protein HDV06_006945 [Boothiomyces sp. JEL0866]|nr:hypothetical protein HDV06_006945 [Boothiomyces sp. JEL0866]